MWQNAWRERIWQQIELPWDVVIVGGGITGAGILREAARLGLRALLVEQRDFAWGTSSRSSKLVHGGLRYLSEGQVRLTRASVRERQRLLAEGPGLIEPLGFLIATYKGDRPGRWTYKAGLSVYDLLARRCAVPDPGRLLRGGGREPHQHYSTEDFEFLAPHLAQNGLTGGFRYADAQTDDARLVLRVLQEAVAAGGRALNYAAAEELILDPESGQVAGVRVREAPAADCGREGTAAAGLPRGRVAEVHSRAVINATGPWADALRGQLGEKPRIRPLQGSHLIFPAYRLPIAQAISFLHPADHRPVFIFPWEGITLVGTTDLDHDGDLSEEPAISQDEVKYLMDAVKAQFPSLGLEPGDAMASFSGVRPVIGSGKADPSKESRDHVVWQENGLLTVTGGKLTTFSMIARDALEALRDRFPDWPEPDRKARVLDPAPANGRPPTLGEAAWRRLVGRYGAEAAGLTAAARPGELEPMPGLPYTWAELRWAAGTGAVVHLDDLLLRRVRLGLLLPEGGEALLPHVKAICREEMGWDRPRWEAEVERYREVLKRAYGVPRS